jgi:hypothetical protein
MERAFLWHDRYCYHGQKDCRGWEKQIFDQRLRIERQHELIARHERDGYPDLVADAVRTLGEMHRALARMEAHYAKAQEHLAEVTVDEPCEGRARRADVRSSSAAHVGDHDRAPAPQAASR